MCATARAVWRGDLKAALCLTARQDISFFAYITIASTGTKRNPLELDGWKRSPAAVRAVVRL